MQEEREMLLGEEQKVHSTSLNMGFSHIETKPAENMAEFQKGHALTMRTQSLATRGDIDPIALVERAKKVCREPIKLSWHNVFFEVDVKTTEQERARDPAIGLTKR